MKADLVLGIDEAGRGPGLGPMVLAAVALDEAAERELALGGVKDSKAFGSGPAARGKRAALAALVRRHAAFCAVEVCEVAEIDAYVARGGLNELERERARRLVLQAPACRRIIADGRAVFAPLAADLPGLVACDRAEKAHLAVAAASLCAKDLRDRLFASIASRYRNEFGELAGGGYMTPATYAFVAEHVRRHGCLPAEARKSWPWPAVAGLSDGTVRSSCQHKTDALP
jgi:ribonuclease HII